MDAELECSIQKKVSTIIGQEEEVTGIWARQFNFIIKWEDWEMGWPDERHHQKSSHILQSGQSLAGLCPVNRKEGCHRVSVFRSHQTLFNLLKIKPVWF